MTDEPDLETKQPIWVPFIGWPIVFLLMLALITAMFKDDCLAAAAYMPFSIRIPVHERGTPVRERIFVTWCELWHR